ncbi:hypothetical protein ACFQV4_20060 [Streptomyces thermocarboxydus]
MLRRPGARTARAGRAADPGRAALTVTAAQSSNLAVISGMAGAGKTTLSLRWAQRTRDSFPDGQFFVALRGHDRHLPPWNPPRRSPGSCSRWDSPPPTSRSGSTNGPRCTGRCSSDGGC